MADDAVRASLRRIDEVDGDIGAFVEVFSEHSGGDPADGLLGGVPVAVKELFDVRSADNSYGSLTRPGRRAAADATVVARLRAAGAAVVGTTRSHEFGWGITTVHDRRGATRNPRDRTRIAGGSSGGSAAAVAGGMVPLALGTDTGGSIRIPAAFCGVLGLKTTPGRISRHGCVPLAPTFDTPGFLATSVDLLARALEAVAGPDPDDPATVAAPSPDHGWRLAERFRFAVPDDLQPKPLSGARRAALDQICEALGVIGGEPTDAGDLGLGGVDRIAVTQIMAEAYFVHTRVLGSWPEAADAYGPDLAARLRKAETVTLDDFLGARAAAKRVRARFARAFGGVDVMVNVVGAGGPSTLADPDRVTVEGTSMSLLAATMPSTLPQNVAGLPSLTLPAGERDDGLPIGVQITGPPWSELLLLDLGRRLERAGAIRIEPATPAT